MGIDRQEIFEAVKPLIARYARPLTVTSDDDVLYRLTSTVDVAIAVCRKANGYFAGLVVKSSYPGFYFMPVDAEPLLATVTVGR